MSNHPSVLTQRQKFPIVLQKEDGESILILMPAGDAQRSWFPEMLEDLEERWSPELSWESCAKLCAEFTDMRTRLKTRRGIKSAKMRCKSCGGLHEMGPPPIGIRSMLFALKKIEVVDEDVFSELDKQWNSYRRKHKLDPTGRPKETVVTKKGCG